MSSTFPLFKYFPAVSLFFSIAFVACKKDDGNTPSGSGNTSFNTDAVKDVEGNIYKTVTIGKQVWMKENLSVGRYKNGDSIPSNLGVNAWGNFSQGALSIYDNDIFKNTKYGKLYNLIAVVDPRGLCPNGWHVPTHHDYNILSKYLVPESDTTDCCYVKDVGGMLKSTGVIDSSSGLWYYPNTGATNSSGFSAVPGGYRNSDGNYYGIGLFSSWWTSTEIPSNGIFREGAFVRIVRNNSDLLELFKSDDKHRGNSVRCLKDSTF